MLESVLTNANFLILIDSILIISIVLQFYGLLSSLKWEMQNIDTIKRSMYTSLLMSGLYESVLLEGKAV